MARERSLSACPDPHRVAGPVRTCVGCRERAMRTELLRMVAGTDVDGRPAAVPDPTRTMPGRGAHLHPTAACYALAVRRKAIGRALRAGPALDTTAIGEAVEQQPASTSTTRTTSSTDSAPAPAGSP